ncbi:MAG: hypothetical protein OEW69_09005 [Nitrospirota bacterium]|nr:hypothetical protein [Nitrospirota bacterium]
MEKAISRISGAAGWIIQSLIFAVLMSTYYFYRPPQNLLESLMAFTFCFVTAWLGKKLLQFWMRNS